MDMKRTFAWGKEAGVNFGSTAKDYAKFRAGFPPEAWVRLSQYGLGLAGQTVLDLGTGTGTVARGLAKCGCKVTALDPSIDLLKASEALEEEELKEDAGIEKDFTRHRIEYVQAKAEETTLPSSSFDLVIAGQCWHWFDSKLALKEVERLLKPEGKLVICHFDWLPLHGNVAHATEQVILKHNPEWTMHSTTGFYPTWTVQAAEAGYTDIETFSFDVKVPYSHVAWRGRIRASAPIGGTLSEEKVAVFEKELQEMMESKYPADPLVIPHRVWAMIAASQPTTTNT